MKLEEFNYDLPKELIAQEPAEPRDSCRLMMLEQENRRIYPSYIPGYTGRNTSGGCICIQ